jgi:predicted nuclease of predicted toxin-antitoxin system
VKFLIDAQLPKSLSDLLISKGHDAVHTLDLPDANLTSDAGVIAVSKAENRIVVSKDSDFLESYLLTNSPEKLVLVKTGNIRNADLLSIFEKNLTTLCALLSENSLIEINKTEIVVHG